MTIRLPTIKQIVLPEGGVTQSVITPSVTDEDGVAFVLFGDNPAVVQVGGGILRTPVDDAMLGGDERETAHGFAGDDQIDVNGGDDRVLGGEGDDFILGGDGADVLFGNAGDDEIDGEAGDDVIRGGAGNDLLFGDAGDDLLFGQGGNDRLNGGQGADFLNGGAGDDILQGGGGDNTLTGGAGADSFIFNIDQKLDFLIGTTQGPASDVITDFDAAADLLDLSGSGLTDLDALLAGARDTTYGMQINLGDGNFIKLIGVSTADLNGDNVALAAPRPIEEAREIEAVFSSESINSPGVLHGGLFADTLVGSSGDDFIYGGFSADILFGLNGDDRLAGGSGDDVLRGGAGDDVLIGGDGADRFVFAPGGGADFIKDFDVSEDILDLRRLDIGDAAIVLRDGAVGVEILAGDGIITLAGVDADDLSAANLLL